MIIKCDGAIDVGKGIGALAGGEFISFDRGNNWTHIDTPPPDVGNGVFTESGVLGQFASGSGTYLARDPKSTSDLR